MENFWETIQSIFESIFKFLENVFRTILNFLWDIVLFIAKYPLATIFIIVLLYFVFSTSKDVIYYRKCKRTEYEVRSRFGYTIYLSAPIRTGKTTLMSGLSHILTNVLIRLAYGTKSKVKKIIVEADFMKIDESIRSCFVAKKSIQETLEFVLNENPILFSKTYKDPVDREKAYIRLLEDYIKAEYALLTNNYVFSAKETPFYNRITQTYRKRFDFKSMQLKNAFDDGVFQLSNYNIILEDEKGLNPGKKESQYMQAASEDDGMPEFLRIIGNAGQETIYYITTNQEAKRWLSTERHLMQTNILINDMKVISIHSFYRKVIALLNRIVHFFYQIAIFFHFSTLKKKVYCNRPNIFKRLNRKLFDLDQRLFAKNVIQYDVQIYENVDDVGKKNTVANVYYYEMSLYLPLTFCFGNIDTHLYSFIFDILEQKSHISLFDSLDDTAVLSDEEKSAVVDNLLVRKSKKNQQTTATVSKNEKEEETLPPPDLH